MPIGPPKNISSQSVEVKFLWSRHCFQIFSFKYCFQNMYLAHLIQEPFFKITNCLIIRLFLTKTKILLNFCLSKLGKFGFGNCWVDPVIKIMYICTKKVQILNSNCFFKVGNDRCSPTPDAPNGSQRPHQPQLIELQQSKHHYGQTPTKLVNWNWKYLQIPTTK